MMTTVSDIQTDLHNYLCNNLEDSLVVAAAVDVVMFDVHINLHSSIVMDNAWDYNSRNRPMAMMVMRIDSNWRNFDKLNYLIQDIHCSNYWMDLQIDREILDAFLSHLDYLLSLLLDVEAVVGDKIVHFGVWVDIAMMNKPASFH